MAYRGVTATFPIGLQGLHGARNPSKLGPGHLVSSEGLDIDQGVLVKEGGAGKLNATPLIGPILAGHQWYPAADTWHDIVLIQGGTVRRDSNGAGTFPTLLRSGLVDPNVYPPHFVRAGSEAVATVRKLFMFSDSNQVQTVNGTGVTMADITGPAVDWATDFPIFGVHHAFRLFAGGNANDPHRIYYTTTASHNNFSGGGTVSIFPGEGDGLVGGVSFRGLLLLWKKPRGIYVLDTRDPAPANWSVAKLTDAVGAASPCGIVSINNDVLFQDPGGSFHLMSAVQEFGDIKSSDIGNQMDIRTFIRRTCQMSNLTNAIGIYYPDRQKAYYHLPRVGFSDTLNERLIIDFSDPEYGVRMLPSTRDEGPSLWLRVDPATGLEKPAMGDSDGYVWLLDEDDRNKDGVAYMTEFETVNTDFAFVDPSLAGLAKNGAFIEVVCDLTYQTSIEITPLWDGLPADVINMAFGGGSAALGSFELDVDALAADGIIPVRQRLSGSGRRLQLRIRNGELDDPIRISELRVSFTVADERIRQTS